MLWLRVGRNRLGMAGAIMILVAVLVAVAAPLIAPYDPSSQAASRLLPPSQDHPMGTDELGRDTASRIIFGARVSLQVGILAVGIGLILGGVIGLLAGFYGGWMDDWLMRVVDIMFAFPGLILAIVISGLLGPSRTNAMLAIGIVFAPAFARVIRGSVLGTLQEGYMESARVIGLSDLRMIVHYVLPNISAAVIVMSQRLPVRRHPRPRLDSAISAWGRNRPSRRGAACWPAPETTWSSRPGWRSSRGRPSC